MGYKTGFMEGPIMIDTESRWSEKGFMDRFDQVLKEFPDFTYSRAYDKVEREHIELFAQTRYSSYDSFRMMRRSYIFDNLKK